MRLIDADAMLKRLEEWNRSDSIDNAFYSFCLNRIIEQPTAYDVEKVVEELENAKQKNFEAYKEAADTLNIICNGNVVNAYGNAIDIVKRGGAE